MKPIARGAHARRDALSWGRAVMLVAGLLAPALAHAAKGPAAKADPRAALAFGSDAFEIVPVMQLEGEPYLGANDLARLLETTKF
jgi:hypothetical protein